MAPVHTDSAIVYGDKALAHPAIVSDANLKVKAMQNLGKAHLLAGNFFQAIALFDSTRVILAEKGDSASLSMLNNYLGNAHYHMGNYPIATSYYEKYFQYAKSQRDSARVAEASMKLGDLFSQVGDYSAAKEYTLTSINEYKMLGDFNNLSGAHNSLGTIHLLASNYKEAEKAFQEALDISLRASNKHLQAVVNCNLGELSLKQNLPSRAMDYYKRAEALFETISNQPGLAGARLEIARCLLQTNQLNKAHEYLERGFRLSEVIQDYSKIKIGLKTKADLYYTKGDFDEAIAYDLMAERLEDSLDNAEVENKLAQLRYLHAVKKKEQDLILQQKEKAVLQANMKNLSLTRNLVFIGAGIVLIGGLLIYGRFQYRNRVLRSSVDLKSRELVSRSLQVNENHKLIESLQADVAREMENLTGEHRRGLLNIKRALSSNLEADKNWETLKIHFEKVNPKFFNRLNEKFPGLTTNERKLCAYLRLDLSSKEIAALLNVTHRSAQVARYRLKKKMGLGEEVNFVDFIQKFQ